MSNFCGIDFGTSNSTLGVFINNKPQLINLEHNKSTLPSAVFYESDDNEIVFGRTALDYYKHGYSGRLMRSFKSILGTSLMSESTQINGKKTSFLLIIEEFLKHMKDTAEKECNHSLDSVVLGRPIHFIDNNKQADDDAQEHLRQAAINVGFKNVEFQFEPIAASLKYEQSLTEEKLVLIVDIGGGTSDISIIKLSPERSKKSDRTDDCLANAGVHIGGTDFDRNLSLKNIMPLLGYNQAMTNGLITPKHFYNDIATWHRISQIYKREFILSIKRMKGKLADATQYDRLYNVIDNKLAFKIAMLVEQAKIDLSDETHINSNLNFIEDNLHADFYQKDLEIAIAQQLNSIGETIDKCILNAGLEKSDLDAVFLTGGSSKMAIIKEFISSYLPNIPVDNQDSLSSVGTGLVLDASRRFK